MGVQDISDEKLQQATGKSWQEWIKLFESFNAKDLDQQKCPTEDVALQWKSFWRTFTNETLGEK